MKTFSFALSLLAAGLVSAQTPAPAPAPGQRPHMRPGAHGNPDDMFEKRLTDRLGLNATQQNGVHTALAESRVLQNGLGPQMHTLHTQMLAAVKAGNTDQIEQISQQLGTLHNQQTAIHAKAMAKIYSGLTTDQKAKVGDNLEVLMGPRMGFGGGPGPRGPRPAPGTPAAPKQQ
jgi:periplasmic protein CpxP/Spy